jgi:hypothetical protein
MRSRRDATRNRFAAPRELGADPTMEPTFDTLRSHVARLRAERDAYLSQRDDLANAIGAHCLYHPEEPHEADSELWNAYEYVMGHQLAGSPTRRRPVRD